MPLYAMVGYDHPNAAANREPIRSEHRAYFRANLAPVRLAGAFNNDRSEQIGTMVVFEADDEKAVWDWIKAEPFYQGGIYQQCEVRLWNPVIGGIEPDSAVAPVS
ncbi:MAG TPA: YciI family protein [Mycobacterium sp.]|nr:YciI family protein [Mycobacterium sp.]